MGLTDRQAILADQVLQAAAAAGSDHLEVLRHLDASPIDKAAVAEHLEGAGAGTEFLLATADATCTTERFASPHPFDPTPVAAEARQGWELCDRPASDAIHNDDTDTDEP